MPQLRIRHRSSAPQRPHPDNRLSPLNLRLSPRLNARARLRIVQATAGLPELCGYPIAISFQPRLSAYRGRLLSASERGTPVYAASFIRKRSIVLETELLKIPETLRLIVVHELFHFVWARLGNPARLEFTGLLDRERLNRARGELGESAAAKKHLAFSRDYVCESFCDTAAWMYAGVKHHSEFTLSARWRNQRRAWFECTFERVRNC